MFNDDFVIGEFSEGTPVVRWPGYDDEALWKRIEAYIVWRWGERPVEWIIRGTGLFMPPLKPVNVTAIYQYGAGEWIPQDQIPTPFGVEVPPGYYRIRGIAGKNETPPADVLEAYTRMVEYIASVNSTFDAKENSTLNAKKHRFAGTTSVSRTSANGASQAVHRPVTVIARALEYSGAADLLKAYRYV